MSNPEIPAAPAGPLMPVQDPSTLALLKRRTGILLLFILPAIVLTILLVVSDRRATPSATHAEKTIPAVIITSDKVWSSTKSTFPELYLQILETRDYIFRTYGDGSAGGNPVDLCVVFSADNRKGTHPPDVCLEAAGARIITRSDRDLLLQGEKLQVREIITSTSGAQGDQYVYFAYFYKCGDDFTPSFYSQQVKIIWNGLTQQNTGGALIRYSTPMAKFTDLEKARGRTDELITVTYPFLKKLSAATKSPSTKI